MAAVMLLDKLTIVSLNSQTDYSLIYFQGPEERERERDESIDGEISLRQIPRDSNGHLRRTQRIEGECTVEKNIFLLECY